MARHIALTRFLYSSVSCGSAQACATLGVASALLSCNVTSVQQPALHRHAWIQQHSASGTSLAAGYSSTSSGTGDEAVVDQMDKIMEVMMQNPTVMQMMMSRMPPHMRRPEVLKAMMANPEIRARMSALAQQTGLGSILQGVDVSKVSESMSATLQAGIDPARMVERFQQSPSLAKAMENPRVLSALMDMASNGPEALKKYEGDKEVIEAAMEAGDLLQQLQAEGAGGGCSSSGTPCSSSSDVDQAATAAGSTSSSGSLSAVEQQLGVKPEELMQRLMARPDLVARVQDPQVQKALMEVSQSPWKIVKYLFNKDVMGALKEMRDLTRP